MKKYLLPENGNFYKANLHCHSNISDGDYTPLQLKDLYKSHGYSVLAITDHNLLVPHHELDDDEFLALSGYELNMNEAYTDHSSKLHLCAISLKKDNIKDPCWHSSKYIYAEERAKGDLVCKDEDTNFERIYSPSGVNKMISTLRENGFFVTYNHPSWSLETAERFGQYEGMNAMEIYNHGCFIDGFHNYDDYAYDQMLRKHKRVFCIAADDNHNKFPFESRKFDSFGGWINIKADKLDYRTITKALENGDFYASQGPEIYDLYYEDGKVYITCSDAEDIILSSGVRYSRHACGNKGEYINDAVFEVPKQIEYFRITVYGKDGKKAFTNAFFTEEITKWS
ncbi:MAG: PHP domain-containing protein [Clostridia bacterium]|nr:PHP domain-containing protein [Clostridia bacterium]